MELSSRCYEDLSETDAHDDPYRAANTLKGVIDIARKFRNEAEMRKVSQSALLRKCKELASRISVTQSALDGLQK